MIDIGSRVIMIGRPGRVEWGDENGWDVELDDGTRTFTRTGRCLRPAAECPLCGRTTPADQLQIWAEVHPTVPACQSCRGSNPRRGVRGPDGRTRFATTDFDEALDFLREAGLTWTNLVTEWSGRGRIGTLDQRDGAWSAAWWEGEWKKTVR